MTLPDLIARLEKSEGPLDMQTRAEILHLCHCPKIKQGYEWTWAVATGDAGEDELQISCQGWERAFSAIHQFPDTSLDAALTLVPDNKWEWELTWLDGIACAKLGDPLLYLEGEAPTPAIALVLASLRARAAREGE